MSAATEREPLSTRHLLLVRHTESVKNVNPAFSLEDSTERLTLVGSREARDVGRAIRRFCERRRSVGISVYAAASTRAVECATSMSVAVDSVCQERGGLESIHTGSLAGVTEERAAALSPAFVAALVLYRKGVLSAYEVALPLGAEDHRVFEQRVQKAMSEIVDEGVSDVKVVCLHRSPLTATLINYARRYHLYPIEFYGYVELPLGSISWIERVDDRWHIRAVGVSGNDLAAL